MVRLGVGCCVGTCLSSVFVFLGWDLVRSRGVVVLCGCGCGFCVCFGCV